MASTQINQNLIPADPELDDLGALWRKMLLLMLQCHHVATVESFDSVKQTATLTINYKKTFFDKAQSGGFVPRLEDYPVLTDVPVIFLGGGNAVLTFPLVKGDECSVFFNDRDIDNWFINGTTTEPNATSRLHSFSDAIALVGLRSQPKKIANFDTERARLQKGAAAVAVGKDDKVLIAGNLTVPTTLNTQLQQLSTQLTTLCTHIQTLITQTAAITVTGPVVAGAVTAGPPLNAAAITAVNAQVAAVSTAIGNIATAIGGFLE